MKTIEEVSNHLKSVGYTRNAITKICGFLVGKGLKTNDEILKIKVGNSDFEDFLDWFDNEYESYGVNDICFGDFVHVQDGIDVVALGCLYGDTFIGTDGNAVAACKVTNKTRPCDEKETEELTRKMAEENIAFDEQMFSFAPSDKMDYSNDRVVKIVKDMDYVIALLDKFMKND